MDSGSKSHMWEKDGLFDLSIRKIQSLYFSLVLYLWWLKVKFHKTHKQIPHWLDAL